MGPSDPELLTLKAYKTLKGVNMIVAPRSSEAKRSRALHTVEKVIKERDCIVVEPVFPMTKDRDKLKLYWKKAREEVLEKEMAVKLPHLSPWATRACIPHSTDS